MLPVSFYDWILKKKSSYPELNAYIILPENHKFCARLYSSFSDWKHFFELNDASPNLLPQLRTAWHVYLTENDAFTFINWMKLQQDRYDLISGIAIDVIRDPNPPHGNAKCKKWIEHICGYSPHPQQEKAIQSSWELFEKDVIAPFKVS